MSTRERPRDRALQRAARIQATIGGEVRQARQGAGLSLRAAAEAVGLDHSQLARIERGLVPNVTVAQLSLACAAVGLELSSRAYPLGDPVRDAAHLKLLARFRAELPPELPWRSEMPLAIRGDLRAVDAVTRAEGTRIGFEAETRVNDVQALERKVLLKKRDAGLTRIVLLIADTKANRGVLRVHREALRPSFPLDGRAILRALRAGRLPAADGIVVI